MANPYQGLEKSVDAVASAISSLSKSEERGRQKSEREARRVAVDVDLLTSAEVDELRSLIEHEGDLGSFVTSRLDEGGRKVEGMYVELERLGLVLTANGSPVLVQPIAHWAVEKRAQLDAEREEQGRAQRRHDYALAVLTTIVGGLLALISSVVTSLVG